MKTGTTATATATDSTRLDVPFCFGRACFPLGARASVSRQAGEARISAPTSSAAPGQPCIYYFCFFFAAVLSEHGWFGRGRLFCRYRQHMTGVGVGHDTPAPCCSVPRDAVRPWALVVLVLVVVPVLAANSWGTWLAGPVSGGLVQAGLGLGLGGGDGEGVHGGSEEGGAAAASRRQRQHEQWPAPSYAGAWKWLVALLRRSRSRASPVKCALAPRASASASPDAG